GFFGAQPITRCRVVIDEDDERLGPGLGRSLVGIVVYTKMRHGLDTICRSPASAKHRARGGTWHTKSDVRGLPPIERGRVATGLGSGGCRLGRTAAARPGRPQLRRR